MVSAAEPQNETMPISTFAFPKGQEVEVEKANSTCVGTCGK